MKDRLIYKVDVVDDNGNKVDERVIINKSKLSDEIFGTGVSTAVGIVIGKWLTRDDN